MTVDPATFGLDVISSMLSLGTTQTVPITKRTLELPVDGTSLRLDGALHSKEQTYYFNLGKHGRPRMSSIDLTARRVRTRYGDRMPSPLDSGRHFSC